MSLGENIKNARKKAGLTQEELASQIGIKKSTLSNYENGIREPDAIKIVKISKALGVSGDKLLETDFEDGYCKEKLDKEEKELLEAFRQLNRSGKDLLTSTAKAFVNNPDMKKDKLKEKAIS